MKKCILTLCFFSTAFVTLTPYAHAVYIHKPVRTIEQPERPLPEQGSAFLALKAPPTTLQAPLA